MNTTQDVLLSLMDTPETFRLHELGSIDTLAQDLQRNGQLQEIIVTPIEGGRYELVAGQRRTLAMKQLNWTHARAQVREGLSELQKALIMIAENEERDDVKAFDRALSYHRAIQAGATPAVLAERLGVAPNTVSEVLGWLTFTTEVMAELRRRNLSGAKLTELKRLEDPASQLKLAKACDEKGWSHKMLRDKVNRILGGSDATQEASTLAQPPAAFQFKWKKDTLVVKPRAFEPEAETAEDYIRELTAALQEYLSHSQKPAVPASKEAQAA